MVSLGDSRLVMPGCNPTDCFHTWQKSQGRLKEPSVGRQEELGALCLFPDLVVWGESEAVSDMQILWAARGDLGFLRFREVSAVLCWNSNVNGFSCWLLSA